MFTNPDKFPARRRQLEREAEALYRLAAQFERNADAAELDDDLLAAAAEREKVRETRTLANQLVAMATDVARTRTFEVERKLGVEP